MAPKCQQILLLKRSVIGQKIIETLWYGTYIAFQLLVMMRVSLFTLGFMALLYAPSAWSMACHDVMPPDYLQTYLSGKTSIRYFKTTNGQDVTVIGSEQDFKNPKNIKAIHRVSELVDSINQRVTEDSYSHFYDYGLLILLSKGHVGFKDSDRERTNPSVVHNGKYYLKNNYFHLSFSYENIVSLPVYSYLDQSDEKLEEVLAHEVAGHLTEITSLREFSSKRPLSRALKRTWQEFRAYTLQNYYTTQVAGDSAPSDENVLPLDLIPLHYLLAFRLLSHTDAILLNSTMLNLSTVFNQLDKKIVGWLNNIDDGSLSLPEIYKTQQAADQFIADMSEDKRMQIFYQYFGESIYDEQKLNSLINDFFKLRIVILEELKTILLELNVSSERVNLVDRVIHSLSHSN